MLAKLFLGSFVAQRQQGIDANGFAGKKTSNNEAPSKLDGSAGVTPYMLDADWPAPRIPLRQKTIPRSARRIPRTMISF
jgi:hypothetical protein